MIADVPGDNDEDEDDGRDRLRTRAFSPSAELGWSFVIAALERVTPWAVMALRLGTLALLQECTRAMAQEHAPRALVVRAKELVAALDRMSWDA